MYSGEAEKQANTKSLNILRSQILNIKTAARDLRNLINGEYGNSAAGRKELVESILEVEDTVEGDLRNKITASILYSYGTTQSRVAILNASYKVDDLAGCLADTALNVDAMGSRKIVKELIKMTDLTQEMILKIDSMLLLQINNDSIKQQEGENNNIEEITNEVHTMERECDKIYRSTLVKLRSAALNSKNSNKAIESMSSIDILKNLEELSDSCMTAADSFLILSTAI